MLRNRRVRNEIRSARNTVSHSNPRHTPSSRHTETLEHRTLLAVTPFDVPVLAEGVTPVTLQPIESVAPNQATRVSFGVPFPKGFVTDLSEVRLLTSTGAEKAVSIQELTPWRDLGTLTNLSSVRSALVQTDVAFPDTDGDGDADPVSLQVEWGRTARTLPALAPVSVRSTWAPVSDEDFPSSQNVWEPKAYAVFSADWYGKSMLKSRLQPFGTESDPAFANYEQYFLNFGRTAVNDVDPRVTDANKVHYLTDYDPWLFDRASTLYQLGFRTGSFQFLREAHRASQFYANHITPSGYFDLRDGDMKYVYGENVSTNYWLTGDERLVDVHRRMIPAFDSFNATYTSSTGFWTERHAAFKLLGYTSGYELLGDAAVGQKARNTFSAYVNMQENPVAGAPENGLLMHTSSAGGEGGGEFVASPWMSVLLVDAVERYYVHSGDARVGSFVTRMADGLNRIGESMYYDTFNGRSVLVPYYLAGPGLSEDQHVQDVFADVEHAQDVSKIFALAYFFTRADGNPSSTYLGRFNELLSSADAAFDHWYRPGGPESGLTVYRLSPPRKFNWWFRTTADIDYLVAGDIGGGTSEPGPATVQFGSGSYTASETSPSATITVTRAGDTSVAGTVNYATSNGTATAGSDYTAASGTLSFAAGEVSRTFSIPLLNDTLVESNETVNVTLSNATGVTLGSPASATLTITSDDTAPVAPTVRFSSATYTAGEAAGTATITVTRAGDTAGASTVAYATQNGTATAGSDYNTATGTLAFAAGETSKTFSITLLNDTLVENNETVSLSLTSPSGATLGTPATAVLTITSEDTPPTTTEPVAYFSFDEGTGTTADGGRLDGTINGATWADGRSGGALRFDGVNDWVSVPDDAALRLSNAVTVEAWVNPADADTWQTVLLKERPGGLTYALYRSWADGAPSATVNNGGTRDVHTAAASPLPLNAWSHLAFTYDGGTARLYVNGDEVASQAVAGPLVTGAGVLGIGGNTVWANEFFAGLIDEVYVYNRALTPAEIQQDMEAGIPDPEPVLPVLEFSSASYTVSEGTPSLSVVVTRTGDTSSASTVAYATSNGSATAGSDYTATSGTLSFAAGETSKAFTIPITDDAAVEPNETFNVTLSNASGATLGPRTAATATIASEDVPPAPTVQFEGGSYTAGEGVGTFTFTITRSGDTSAASAVDYSTADGTATAGSDYTATSGTLSFAPGETSKTFTVTILDDSLVEENEAVNLSLSNPSGATLGSPAAATLTLTSDDTVPDPDPDPTAPLAHFSFDEGSGTTADGGPLDGTINGATWAAGRVGGALRFDGVDDWVSVADDPSLQLADAVTLEAWVNPADADSWQTVVLKERPGGLSYALYRSWADGAPSATVNNGGSRDVHTVGSALPLDQWSHLAFTYDGGTVRLYVNGEQVASQAVAGPLVTGNGVLAIGGNTVWPTEYFAGLIDEVYVYGRALSQAEIQRDMNAGVPEPDPDPVLPVVEFESGSYGAGEGAGTVTVTVTRSGDTSVASTVAWATEDGTAVAGSDYTAASGTITFAAGEVSKTFVVQLADDAEVESAESLTVRLSSPSGATLGSRASASVGITDNDVPPEPEPTGRVVGRVFNDRNRNGVRNSGESWLPNVRVYVDADRDGTWDDGERSVLTDTRGEYVLAGLPAGSHLVRVAPPAGWAPTVPSAGVHTVTLADGQAVSNYRFGLRRL